MGPSKAMVMPAAAAARAAVDSLLLSLGEGLGWLFLEGTGLRH